MKALGAVIASVGLLLATVAGIVFGLDDRTIFVPSPAMTVQGFLRTLSVHRFDMAVSYLDAELEERVDPGELQRRFKPVQQGGGEIINVNGEWEVIRGDSATAGASLKTAEAGLCPVTMALHLENGVWKIARLDGLDTAALRLVRQGDGGGGN